MVLIWFPPNMRVTFSPSSFGSFATLPASSKVKFDISLCFECAN